MWFIPGSFRFCLRPDCDAYYDGSMRSDVSKLSALSSEGRSSATTVLALSAMKYLIGTDLDTSTKKLLAFTDNRQDASLQAGHFNDFIQVLLLRGACWAAMHSSPEGRLTDDVLAQRVLDHLYLDPTDYTTRTEVKEIRARNMRGTLRDVLGYRLYFDLQRSTGCLAVRARAWIKVCNILSRLRAVPWSLGHCIRSQFRADPPAL